MNCCFGFKGIGVSAVFLSLFLSLPASAVSVPVLMYHDFVPDDAPCGEYAVTEAEFRSQLEALYACGYESVTFGQLIGYADGENDLPDKPVIITADDGYDGVIRTAVPVLREFGMTLSCAVIGSMAGEDDHFALEEIPDCVEIVSHTYDLHRDYGKVRGVDAADEEELRRDISRMRLLAEEYPMIGKVLVYPYGAYSDMSESILAEEEYRITVTCDRGTVEAERGQALFRLPRFGVWHGMSGGDLMRVIGDGA